MEGKNNHMKKTLLSLVAVALFVVVAPSAFAQAQWSAVASTGAIQPGSAPHAWGGPTLQFAGASVGTIVARYNVTNTFGAAISSMPGWSQLRAAIDDNTAAGSVRVRLVEVPHCNNVEKTLCALGSIDTLGTQCPICQYPPLDFSLNSYYVEVLMNRNANVALSVTAVDLY